MNGRQVNIPPLPDLDSPRPKRRHKAWLIWLTIAIVIGAWLYRDKITLIGDINIVTPFTRKEVLGGKVLSITPVASLTLAQVDGSSRAVYNDGALQPARYAVEQYNITYTSTDPRTDKQIEVTGRVYLPSNAGKRPLIVFGPGTTGPGPICAPTLEKTQGKNWGRYDNLLSFYAGQGYGVAMTDYPFRSGETAISPYFIGEPEGRAMLDLARAMQNFKVTGKFNASPVGDQIFFSGYSQGGHAALWAQKLRDKYASEVKSSGLVLFAPATDLHKTFYDTAYGATTVWLPAYLYAAYSDYYGLQTPASDIFKDPFAPTVERDARIYCIDEVEPATHGKKYFGTNATIAKLYQPAFLNAMRAKDISQVAPELSRLMRDNLAGEPTDVPVLIISGSNDRVIFASAQAELAKRICRGGGSNLQWEQSTETHYTGMFRRGRSKVLSWLGGIVAGSEPASQCSSHLS